MIPEHQQRESFIAYARTLCQYFVRGILANMQDKPLWVLWKPERDELGDIRLHCSRTREPFNKLRMCVFPKHYLFNENSRRCIPFLVCAVARVPGTHDQFGREEASRGWSFDFERFDPAFFRHFERRVADLMALDIEVDIILFHPYDRWGFAAMDAETDNRYLRYVVARLAAYRNIWWSMANEDECKSDVSSTRCVRSLYA
jgi:hypothetical protein